MPKKSLKKMSDEEKLFLGLGIAEFAKDRVEDLIGFMVKEIKMAKNATQARKQLEMNGKKTYQKMVKMMEKGANMAMKEVKKPMKKTKRSSPSSRRRRTKKK